MNLDADPYRTLGLTRGASLDDVKRAYRRLAKANHPDVAGAAALPRFLAIRAAYEQLAGSSASSMPGARTTPTARRRQTSSDADPADATRRAYGGRPRGPRAGAGPPGSSGPAGRGRTGAGAGRADTGGTDARRDARDPAGAPRPREDAGAGRPGGASPGAAPRSGGTTQASPGRGKATLGSTSYDGADAGPFEPDWGGASWYGTTSGTYWTINPKEYADPRKHGPEYQARARRSAAAKPGAAAAKPGAAGLRDAEPGPGSRQTGGAAGSPTHTTSWWWESTAGPDAESDEFASDEEPGGATPEASRPGATSGRARTASGRSRATSGRAEAEPFAPEDLAPDPAQAAIDLGRALTDPRSGGLRGRAVRAALGWLPIALGLGWLIGELTGCGRFAATCDTAVAPLTAAGQAIVLVVLFLIPEIAAITAGAALVLLATATAATLILSATGSAADEGSRRAALAALLMVAWLSGLGIAIVRRLRAGSRPARPVS